MGRKKESSSTYYCKLWKNNFENFLTFLLTFCKINNIIIIILFGGDLLWIINWYSCEYIIIYGKVLSRTPYKKAKFINFRHNLIKDK